MRLHFLVEGTSEERFLNRLLPRLISGHKWRIYPHQGKGRLPGDPAAPPDRNRRGILDQLPAMLRGWAGILDPKSDRVVVLVGLDQDDCVVLLQAILALRDQMKTPEYLVRIAIEEVEAWYLGDWKALRSAFPSADHKAFRSYKPDSICGTWERFQQVIGDKLERKTAWAEKMGAALSVDGRSRSESFKRFCDGVRRLAGDTPRRVAVRKKADEPQLRRQAIKHRKKVAY